MKTCEALLDKIPDEINWEEVQERNEADSSPLKVSNGQKLRVSTELSIE